MLVLPCVIKINEEENKSCYRETEVNSDAIRKIAEHFAWTSLYPINIDAPKSEVLAHNAYPVWASVGGQRRMVFRMDMSTRIYSVI